MRIQDAINSGKKFRRPVWNNEEYNNWFTYISDLQRILLNEDIIASDWEVLLCEKHDVKTDIGYKTLGYICVYCENEKVNVEFKGKDDLLGMGYKPIVPKSMTALMELERLETATKLLDTLSFSEKEIESILGGSSCECGSEIVGSSGHSQWCPKHG